MKICRKMGAGYQDRIIIIREMSFPNSLPWGTFKVVICHMQLELKEGTTAYCVHTVKIRVGGCYCISWSLQGRVPKRITQFLQKSPAMCERVPCELLTQSQLHSWWTYPSVTSRIPRYSQIILREDEGNTVLHNKHIHLCKYLD